MPKFTYIAMDKTGKRLSGSFEAESVATASRSLKARELQVISVKPLREKSDILQKIPFLGSKKIKLKDLVIFTRQLSTMINAGVPLVRSLATLKTQTENKSFQVHIGEVTKDVEGGMSFADSLAKHPKVFSSIYINMVRAGEAGGILDQILKSLATQQEKDSKIRGKFKSAMTYPIILLTITMLVFIALMVIVMPKIGKIVLDLGGPDAKLPKLTQVMIGISDFMVTRWYVLIGVLGLLVFITVRGTATVSGRRKRDQLLLKTPVIKLIVKKVAIARFARIFASLMTAGVTVIEAIEVTAKAIGNAVIEDELMDAAKAVANGQQFSVPLSESKVFPPIVSQMMSIGEETGQTDQILVKVAEFYEDEVDVMVDSLSSILEPIMIVVMGVMVGLIAASVIGPISNLSSQI